MAAPYGMAADCLYLWEGRLFKALVTKGWAFFRDKVTIPFSRGQS